MLESSRVALGLMIDSSLFGLGFLLHIFLPTSPSDTMIVSVNRSASALSSLASVEFTISGRISRRSLFPREEDGRSSCL